MMDADLNNWLFVAMYFEGENDTSPTTRVFSSQAGANAWAEKIADDEWVHFFDEDEDDDNYVEKPEDRDDMSIVFWGRAGDCDFVEDGDDRWYFIVQKVKEEDGV